MPPTTENWSVDQNDEINSPVVSLKDGLPIRELISTHQTEFEIRPQEEDASKEINSAESYFDFDDLERVVNLDLIDVDQEDGSPFDKYKQKMQNLREDGKIKKCLLKHGVGSLIPDNCLVYVRYQAYLEYGELPFDSTLWQCNADGDHPVPLNLGKAEVLPGLHEGLLSMRKGEKAEFLVHPDLAYGKMGCPPRIPGDATILFVVEVDRFVECAEILANNDDLTMEERKEYCNVRKIADAHYMLGNDHFKNEKFSAAANKYRQVINMMHNSRLADEKEENERNHFLIKNYTNACVCYHKLKSYKRVCMMAADALLVDEKKVHQNAKLLYFWGYAKMMLGEYNSSMKHLKAAKKLLPNDQLIFNALHELEKKKRHAEQQEKMMAEKAFGYARSNQVKIREISEAEEEFRNKISEQLKEFKHTVNSDLLSLKDSFTKEEEAICLELAKELGLYTRVLDGERRSIQIRKPADM